jgi:hypothetical protein
MARPWFQGYECVEICLHFPILFHDTQGDFTFLQRSHFSSMLGDTETIGFSSDISADKYLRNFLQTYHQPFQFVSILIYTRLKLLSKEPYLRQIEREIYRIKQLGCDQPLHHHYFMCQDE